MTADTRVVCPLCGKHLTVRTTGNGGAFLQRKAEKKLKEHQAAGCAGWLEPKGETK